MKNITVQSGLYLLIILILTIANPAVAQTVIWGTDLVSRNNTSTDRVACQYLANQSAPTGQIADDFVVQPNIQWFSVHTISGLGLINGTQADNILEDASDLLNSDDGSGDISCGMVVQRDGAIVSLTAPASVIGGVVSTSADRNALESATGDQAGDVVVVAVLTECGGSGSFNGCASAGRAFTVTTSAPTSTWAHEFGHVQTLPHRPDDNSNCGDAGDENIMFPVGCAGRDRVNTNECSAYYENARC